MGRRSRAIGVAGILAVTLAYLSAVAEANELIATIEHPATVTVAVAPGPDSARAGRHVVLDVTAYTPSRNGVVQGVVTVQKNADSKEQEIGRFGIFPNTEFSAADPYATTIAARGRQRLNRALGLWRSIRAATTARWIIWKGRDAIMSAWACHISRP